LDGVHDSGIVQVSSSNETMILYTEHND
jgi:hypothetical protein